MSIAHPGTEYADESARTYPVASEPRSAEVYRSLGSIAAGGLPRAGAVLVYDVTLVELLADYVHNRNEHH